MMRAQVELSCKHDEDLADINTLLVDLSQRQAELRLAVLRDRLVEVEKQKTRYQRQVDVLSVESYRSGSENREFEDHTEMVMPDHFDEQKGIERDHYSVKYYMQQLRDEINIAYLVDMLKLLTVEKDGPSTSASIAKELILISGPLDQTSGVPGGQPGLGALTGEGFGTVILSSDDFDPGTPPTTRVGPSAETCCTPMAG
ncbi:hypothetical protein PanWU01x14_219170, partial [Parasponia andersonii]